MKLKGNTNIILTGVASLDEAVEGNLAFIRSKKYMKYIDATKASAIIVPKDVDPPDNEKAYLVSDNPYISFAGVLKIFLFHRLIL